MSSPTWRDCDQLRVVQAVGSGNDQLLIAPRLDTPDRGHDAACGLTNPWPARRREDQDRQAAALEVLLNPQVCVSGDQQFEPFLFGQADQIAIGDRGPASFVGRCHIVAAQEAP
jgi:hypothetical protein